MTFKMIFELHWSILNSTFLDKIEINLEIKPRKPNPCRIDYFMNFSTQM